MNSNSTPTQGQLERNLSQRLQALYREQLGHRPGKITCELFDQKLAIVVEESLTSPEQLLAKEGREGLTEEIRDNLDDALKPKLQEMIESVLSVEVVDLLSDVTLETGRTGIIAVLATAPQFRKSGSRKTKSS